MTAPAATPAPARPSRRRVRRARAFTLMEVLIVIALLGLVTALVVTDVGALLDRSSAVTPYESLRAAVETAREHAFTNGTGATLHQDPETGQLHLATGVADEEKKWVLPADAQVRFFLPGDLTDGEPIELESLAFHPSGCAMPALVELTRGGTRTRYRLEPFSAALLEEPK